VQLPYFTSEHVTAGQPPARGRRIAALFSPSTTFQDRENGSAFLRSDDARFVIDILPGDFVSGCVRCHAPTEVTP
jgi:hypothetical protein